MDEVEEAKKRAAQIAVDDYISDNMVIGIGSGTTIVYAVERLAERVQTEKLSVVCIPTSFQSKQLLIQHNLPIGDLERYPELDVVIDGADEVDENLNCIKGGGACLTQEKLVASSGKKFVIIADYRKRSKRLGESWKRGVPIEVIPAAYVPVSRKLEALGGKPKLRMGVAKAGPVITDNNCFILDVDFGIIENPAELDAKLQNIVGVVETGLFVGMAEKAYFGMQDGTVSTRVSTGTKMT